MNIKEIIKNSLFGLALFIAANFLLFYIMFYVALNEDNLNRQLMYDNCCAGYPCTDIYYNPDTNLCHISFGEDYEGLNKGLEVD